MGFKWHSFVRFNFFFSRKSREVLSEYQNAIESRFKAPFSVDQLCNCDKMSNQYPFQRIEGWMLIRGLGAYSREGRLSDIPMSRVGAYTRGAYSRRRLIEPL